MRRTKHCWLFSPIVEGEGITDLEYSLEMIHVARDQHELVLKSDCGNHRVRPAYGLSRTLKIAVNPAGKFGSLLVEGKDFFRDERRKEGANAVRSLGFL